MPGTPGVLLLDASFFGTLAAVRDFGRMGLDVWVGECDGVRSHAGASRFCQTRVAAPSVHSPECLPWLMELGHSRPGMLLYATSDDTLWFMAMHQSALRQVFRLHLPEKPSVFALLDKSQLYAHANRLGVPIPVTHAPASLAELHELGQTLAQQGAFPVIVKPRTQACMAVKQKGTVVNHPDDLFRAVSAMVKGASRYAAPLADELPSLEWPLVQAYLPDAQHHTYSLSGFIDHTGAVGAVRASAKVFQFPVRVGIGVAFEGRPVRQDLVARVESLARAVGYFGVFEVEFIHVASSDTYLLMDFNPRFYGQMQFEISRGMSLPRMVHAAATDDAAQLAALCAQAKDRLLGTEATRQRYCNRWLFGVLLMTQRMGGRLGLSEQGWWKAWMDGDEVYDFAIDPDDPAPQRVQQLAFVRHWLRHPRSSWRDLFT